MVSYLVPDIGESEAYRIEITSGETSAKLSESSYILQVRYKPHLSDKARCSEASRFSVTKIWYVNLYTSVSITACHYLYISAGHEHNAMENVFTEHSAKYKIRMLTVDLQIYIYIYIYIYPFTGVGAGKSWRCKRCIPNLPEKFPGNSLCEYFIIFGMTSKKRSSCSFPHVPTLGANFSKSNNVGCHFYPYFRIFR